MVDVMVEEIPACIFCGTLYRTGVRWFSSSLPGIKAGVCARCIKYCYSVLSKGEERGRESGEE